MRLPAWLSWADTVKGWNGLIKIQERAFSGVSSIFPRWLWLEIGLIVLPSGEGTWGLLLMGNCVVESYKHNLFPGSKVGTIVTLFICSQCSVPSFHSAFFFPHNPLLFVFVLFCSWFVHLLGSVNTSWEHNTQISSAFFVYLTAAPPRANLAYFSSFQGKKPSMSN